MKRFINVPFRWGRLVITQNAAETIASTDVAAAFTRHISCDWGELSDEDWKKNNAAVLRDDDRILSAYTDGAKQKFWIITESDRSCTTILLPSDY